METQPHAETRADSYTTSNVPCGFAACGELAAVDLGSQPLCSAHFFSEAMRELDVRIEGWKSLGFDQSATEGLKTFLGACTIQAQLLAEKELLDNPTGTKRAGEVLRRVSQLSQKLRRSPRFAASVPVWLRREDPGKTWEEQTWTSSISRYGARFSCNRAVDVGGEVVLCRRDKGNRVRARVVYSRYDDDGRREIGVELLDPDDFWDLELRMKALGTEEARTAAN